MSDGDGDSVTIHAALEELERLGTADKIAAYLLEEGFQSSNVDDVYATSESCPIALFLSDRVGEKCYAGVAHVGLADDGVELIWPLPEVVVEFIRAFDYHKYPDLRA